MALRQNTVKVNLTLDDDKFISGLRQVQQVTRNTFNNLSSVVSKSVGSEAFQVAGWLKGFNVIEQAGTAAFDVIKNQIKDAANLQTDLIGAATSYQQLLKVSFKDAKDIAKLANTSFTNNSIGLPFAEFGQMMRSALGDDILGALYNANDVAGSIDKSAQLLSRLQVLVGGTTGVNMGQRVALVTDLLSGNYKKITSQEAFRNNPVLNRAFEEIITGIGGEDAFNKLNKEEKIKKVIEPLSKSISDDVIAAYTNTASGFIGKIQNGLFGTNGIFSFSRDLISSIPDSSLITSITGLLGELTNTFTVLSPILRGIVDPLAIALKGIMDGLSLILKPINTVLGTLGLLEPAIYGLSAALSTLFYVGIAKFGLSSLSGMGAKAATKTPLSAMLGGGKSKSSTVLGIANLASALPFVTNQFKVGLATIKGWGVAMKALNIASVVSGLTSLATVGATTFTALSAGAMAFTAALLTNPITWIVGAFVGASYLIWKNWKPLSEFFKGFFEAMLEDIQPVIDKFSWLGDILKQIYDTAVLLGSEIAKIGDGVGKFLGTQTETNGTERQSGRNFYKSAKSFLGSALNPFKLFGLGNFASGNDPYGVYAALTRESRSMPSGARPAIANTSEMILNKQQQANLLSSRTQPGLNYSPTFIINNKVDEQEIAQISMNALNNWWQREVQAYS